MSTKLTFKSKYLIKSFFNYSSNTKVTKYTINILKKFYKEIHTSKQFVNNIDIKSSAKILNHIVKPVNFSYMEEKVQSNILNTLKMTITYTFSIYNKYVKINFIVDKLDLEYINNCVYKILLWLFIAMKYSNNKNHVNIYLYMTSLEKTLPDNDQSITKYNINSGYTSINENTIVIFRKEEWFKVFIHETLHYFELDFRHDNSIKNKVLYMFKVKSKVNLYEAYTETWAKLLNIIFCSYFSSTEFNIFVNIFDTLINIEKTFITFQTVKILNFMNMDYIDILTGDNIYHENTHILSYFIIGTILLNNYQEFMKFCNINNKNILNFDDESMDKFVNLIKKYYKSKKLFEDIEIVSKIKINNSYILKNTLLSICELY